MTEQEIWVFIKVVTDYFQSATGIGAQIGLPYVKDDATGTLDFTAIIGISGSRKGGIYFTGNRTMLAKVADIILGEDDHDNETIFDLVGEMTNVIAGNLRETFGSEFQISVPIVLKGPLEDICVQLTPPLIIIPINWNSFQSHLGIGLE